MIQMDLERYAQNNWSELMAAVTELTGSQTVKDNRIANIRRSLRRLAYQRDAAGNTYCYDEIEVHSAANFSRMLNARIRGM